SLWDDIKKSATSVLEKSDSGKSDSPSSLDLNSKHLYGDDIGDAGSKAKSSGADAQNGDKPQDKPADNPKDPAKDDGGGEKSFLDKLKGAAEDIGSTLKKAETAAADMVAAKPSDSSSGDQKPADNLEGGPGKGGPDSG